MPTATVENDTQQIDTVKIYRSYHEALKCLSRKRYGDVMFAINDYSLDGIMPQGLDKICNMAFLLIKPLIDKNNERITNGSKGGKASSISGETIQAVLVCIAQGMNVKDVMAKCGVSERTFYRIKNGEITANDTANTASSTATATATATANTATANTATANTGTLSPPQEFLRLWQTTKDANGMCVFAITAGMENVHEWNRLWAQNPWTVEQVRQGFKNLVDAINNGWQERKYIPKHPDKLAADFSRYMDSLKPKVRTGSGVTQSGCDEASGDVPF